MDFALGMFFSLLLLGVLQQVQIFGFHVQYNQRGQNRKLTLYFLVKNIFFIKI